MKQTYWKDIRRAFGKSKGRFLSIMLLMMLGSFALVGLKVTGPDMQSTASSYLKKHNTMDLAVMSDYGLSSDDQKELSSIKGATVEYGYLADVTIKGTDDAVRVFSKTKDISTFELVSGRFAKNSSEIVLSAQLKGTYKIGDTITFSQGQTKSLKKNTFTVVGFANSSEILSTTGLGSSTAGDGLLSSYAIVAPSAFSSDVYTIARIRYNDLKALNPFTDTYSQKLAKHQKALDELLADNGEQRLSSLKSSAQSQIDASQKQLDAAKAQVAQQETLLSSLPQEQAAALQAQLTQAKATITSNEKALASAKADMQALTKPSYTSYTRSTLPGGEGYETYGSSTDSISSIGNLFPVVLYLVAALVTFTTMTRFVDEERTNSGILKALGYDNKAVILKFVIYGFVASMIGTLIGIVAGHYLLYRIIAEIITGSMTIGSTHYAFYWSYTLLAIFLGLISAVLPAYLIARRELSEKPSQLLLPKPPVKGAKVWLEHLPFIWNRLSFTHKVTVRNIFRYKTRMLMTVFGVAGSVSLLFAGLGIQSSLGKVVDNQFKTLMPYDMMVVTNGQTPASLDKFLDSKDVSKEKGITYKSLTETISGVTEKQTVSVMATKSKNFGSFVNLKDAKTKKALHLSDKGAIISEKLAKLYKVKAGDSISITDDSGKKRKVKIAAIAEMNVGHYLFMTDSYYQKLFGEKASTNAYFIKLKNASSSNIADQSTKLLKEDNVTAVLQNASLIKTVQSVVKSLNGAMTILVIVSVMLAVVILYNLTNINVAERIRELSTIKVLGFYNNEVTMYIYRETISLSLIGILLGLVAGKILHQVIMGMIGSSSILFGTEVGFSIYATPIITIILILLVLGFMVNNRLRRVDMLEALKSVD